MKYPELVRKPLSHILPNYCISNRIFSLDTCLCRGFAHHCLCVVLVYLILEVMARCIRYIFQIPHTESLGQRCTIALALTRNRSKPFPRSTATCKVPQLPVLPIVPIRGDFLNRNTQQRFSLCYYSYSRHILSACRCQRILNWQSRCSACDAFAVPSAPRSQSETLHMIPSLLLDSIFTSWKLHS